jgi:hypothetical protein
MSTEAPFKSVHTSPLGPTRTRRSRTDRQSVACLPAGHTYQGMDAGIWRDRHRPAPRGPIAKPQFLLRAFPQNKGTYVRKLKLTGTLLQS